jgi:chemotaxis signal transduction protein
VLAFHSGGQRFLVRLEAVRAVVRLRGVRRLPGSAAGLIGMLDVQGVVVAIYDSRPADPGDDSGDVLVLAAGWPDQAVAVACESVEGLLELTSDSAEEAERDLRPTGLPDYVEALLRVDDAMVPLVDLVGLAQA